MLVTAVLEIAAQATYVGALVEHYVTANPSSCWPLVENHQTGAQSVEYDFLLDRYASLARRHQEDAHCRTTIKYFDGTVNHPRRFELREFCSRGLLTACGPIADSFIGTATAGSRRSRWREAGG